MITSPWRVEAESNTARLKSNNVELFRRVLDGTTGSSSRARSNRNPSTAGNTSNTEFNAASSTMLQSRQSQRQSNTNFNAASSTMRQSRQSQRQSNTDFNAASSTMRQSRQSRQSNTDFNAASSTMRQSRQSQRQPRLQSTTQPPLRSSTMPNSSTAGQRPNTGSTSRTTRPNTSNAGQPSNARPSLSEQSPPEPLPPYTPLPPAINGRPQNPANQPLPFTRNELSGRAKGLLLEAMSIRNPSSMRFPPGT